MPGITYIDNKPIDLMSTFMQLAKAQNELKQLAIQRDLADSSIKHNAMQDALIQTQKEAADYSLAHNAPIETGQLAENLNRSKQLTGPMVDQASANVDRTKAETSQINTLTPAQYAQAMAGSRLSDASANKTTATTQPEVNLMGSQNQLTQTQAEYTSGQARQASNIADVSDMTKGLQVSLLQGQVNKAKQDVRASQAETSNKNTLTEIEKQKQELAKSQIAASIIGSAVNTRSVNAVGRVYENMSDPYLSELGKSMTQAGDGLPEDKTQAFAAVAKKMMTSPDPTMSRLGAEWYARFAQQGSGINPMMDPYTPPPSPTVINAVQGLAEKSKKNVKDSSGNVIGGLETGTSVTTPEAPTGLMNRLDEHVQSKIKDLKNLDPNPKNASDNTEARTVSEFYHQSPIDLSSGLTPVQGSGLLGYKHYNGKLEVGSDFKKSYDGPYNQRTVEKIALASGVTGDDVKPEDVVHYNAMLSELVVNPNAGSVIAKYSTKYNFTKSQVETLKSKVLPLVGLDPNSINYTPK